MTVKPDLERARQHTGELSLYLPADWIDLLTDGIGPEADEAARLRFANLVGRTYPKADPAVGEAGVEGLLAWRAMVMARGMVSHGIVNCSFPGDNPEAGGAVWHVLTAVLDVPLLPPDLDVGELMARLVGRNLDPDSAYVESFSTDMGCGFGLLLQPSLSPAAERGGDRVLGNLGKAGITVEDPDQFRHGLVAALTCPAGGGPGLLVTGICLNPDHLLELAGVVALIASRSRVTPPRTARDGET